MGEPQPITVVGAGLAGCEAALQLARRGLAVELLEMKPARYSPAHHLPGPAELVCSNSLKSDDPDTAHGLLKQELRGLGSGLLEAAQRARVPAGTALAVDRERLCGEMQELLARQPGIRFRPGACVETLPEGMVILATGPLTEGGPAEFLRQASGDDLMHFFDALAPIVSGDSLDREVIFAGSRWGRGADEEYLNCPLEEADYRRFVEALLAEEPARRHGFEETRFFEGCLPIEEMARRGPDTLAFGPMRPVGLRRAGRRPFAVVQLRAENAARTAFNLVGFQTRLSPAGQRRVFRLIPGLSRAEFLRYGAMHRNLYLDAPRLLDDGLRLRACPRVRPAGQITGVEGYVESAAVGLLTGRMLADELQGRAPRPPPPETALGALYGHLRGRLGAPTFEPMNIHFGLLPPAPQARREARRAEMLRRAREALSRWLAEAGAEGDRHV